MIGALSARALCRRSRWPSKGSASESDDGARAGRAHDHSWDERFRQQGELPARRSAFVHGSDRPTAARRAHVQGSRMLRPREVTPTRYAGSGVLLGLKATAGAAPAATAHHVTNRTRSARGPCSSPRKERLAVAKRVPAMGKASHMPIRAVRPWTDSSPTTPMAARNPGALTARTSAPVNARTK